MTPAVAQSAVFKRLHTLHGATIELGLDRVSRLLQALGSPERRLPRVIHVAGTNGKGSTVAFLRAGLEAAGLTTNVFTSPPLIRFGECIRRRGRLMDEADLIGALERVERINAGQPITFYECLAATAFLLFAEEPADVTLVEVCLGGRDDATNVFPHPAVVAVTPIDMDHMEFLGPTLGDIARAKAGVIKPGAALVAAPQAPAALQALREAAEAAGVAMALGGVEWHAAATADGMTFTDGARQFRLPAPALAGPWQIGNASLALAALNRLPGFKLTAAHAASALTEAEWPGRLQRLTDGPLAARAKGRPLWIDGGHNPAAARALAGAIKAWPLRPTAIVGMLRRKDATGFLAALRPAVSEVACIAIPAVDAYPAAALAAAAAAAGLAATPYDSLEAAVDAAAAHAPADAPILICGSLALAGHALQSTRAMDL